MVRMSPFAPPPRDPRLDGLLGEAPRALFSDSLHAISELVDAYGRAWAIELAARLGLAGPLAQPMSAAELAAARGFQPAFVPALAWILRCLAEAGLLCRCPLADGASRYRLVAELPASRLDALRAAALALDPRIAPTLRLFDAAAEIYPGVARGELTGEQALFGAGQIGLWLDYFSERNNFYSVSNELAAVAAANRLRAGSGLRILEVGAGAGSGSAALLAELERRGRLGDLALFHATEPSAFFRRRGERALRARFPAVPLRCASLDINDAALPAAEPPYDLIFGVNVFHVARHLGATLAALAARLTPGGWLLGGECFRLFPGQAIASELVFLLLESFVEVELDPKLRPNPGFLTPEQWTGLFAGARLTRVELVPDLVSLRELYARFFAGVVCGQRPDD